MKKLIGGLIFLLIGSWLASCEVPDTISNAAINGSENARCRTQRGNAVLISLAGENQPHISEVNFSYSLNGGKWLELNNDGTGSVRIVDAGGQYRIKAQKMNYYLESALVIVPYDRDCQILEQTVTFTLRRTNCPTETQLIINVLKPKPVGQLVALVKFPSGETTRRPCGGNDCILNLTLQNNGVYEIIFSGFPYSKTKNPLTPHVSYNYEMIDIQLEDGTRREHIVSEGIDELTLRIPYNVGPNGCLGIAHDNLSVNGTFVFNTDSIMVEIHEDATLFVSDLNSPQCTMTPVDYDLPFDINLPSGTVPGNYSVEYWFENRWEPATCDSNNGEISCVAKIKNPFHSDRYQVRTMINNQEYIATQISLLNKCIYFE